MPPLGAALLVLLSARLPGAARADRAPGRWRLHGQSSPAGGSGGAAAAEGPILAPDDAAGGRSASRGASLVEQSQQERAGFPKHHLAGPAFVASTLALPRSAAFAPGHQHRYAYAGGTSASPATMPSDGGMPLNFAPPSGVAKAAEGSRPATQLHLFKRLKNMRRHLEHRGDDEPGRHLKADTAPWFDKLEGVTLVQAGSMYRDYEARVRGTDFPVAVKVIDVSHAAMRDDLARELRGQMKFGGGDVAKIYEVSWLDDEFGRPMCAILLEPWDGDFSNNILRVVAEEGPGALGRDTKLRLLGEVLRGLKKLADEDFVHRNLAPDNIAVIGNCRALGNACHVKIAGFGLAIPKKDMEEGREPKIVGGGTPYSPPEAYVDDAFMGTGDLSKMDVWSVGRIAYQLFTGHEPETREGATMWWDIDLNADPAFEALKKRDPTAAGLIEQMLAKRTWLRPSIDQALGLVVEAASPLQIPEQPNRELPAEWQDGVSENEQPRRRRVRVPVPQVRLPLLPRVAKA